MMTSVPIYVYMYSVYICYIQILIFFSYMHYSICSCSHQSICGLWRPVKALQHDCCFVASFMFDFARHESFCGTVCFAFQCLSVSDQKRRSRSEELSQRRHYPSGRTAPSLCRSDQSYQSLKLRNHFVNAFL